MARRFDTGAEHIGNGPGTESVGLFTSIEVEAHVLQISRGPDGELTSYDLTAKAQEIFSSV